MAFELYSTSNHRFSFARWEWESILALAQHFGWDGEGPTAHPEEHVDNVGYDSAEFQAVSASDATQLAAALARALAESSDVHLSGIDTGAPQDREISGETFAVMRRSDDNPSAWRARLEEFIAFCQDGGFVIG